MAIANENDLGRAVAQATVLVRDIQSYCGRNLRDDSKFEFPRGLIRTADEYRATCPSYLGARQQSSCAYTFMYLDVVWWLLARTDLSGIAREMVIKFSIVALATVLEALLHIPGQGIFASMAGVKGRLDRAYARAWISERQRDCLKQLWDHRNNIHLRQLDTHEFNKYRTEHFNEPSEALNILMANLKNWDESGRPSRG